MTLEAPADQKTPVTGAGDATTDKTTDTSGTSDNAGGSDDGLLGAGGEGADKPVVTPANWPEDWRAKLSGGDEKILKRLERMGGPDVVVKSWLAAEQKISSGDFKKALPENATDEQKAEWRKANGLPEAPDKYELPKIEGMDWTEADKPMVDAFLTSMFGADASQAQVNAALGTYSKLVADAQAQRSEADKSFRMEQEDKLRTELGAEFRPQINVYKRVLEDPEILPDGLGAVLASARDADGNRLINNAGVAKWLIGLGLEKYGEGALVTGDAKASSENREAELRKVLSTDAQRYFREGLDKELAAIVAKKSGRR
jgi:hypothetical protein